MERKSIQRRSTMSTRWRSALQRTGSAIVAFMLAGAVSVSAQVMVFDRGLPTANLNLAAGANQSNVLWADQETSPVTPYLPGDDFTMPAGGPYNVTTIRVWSIDSTGLVLRGGAPGGPYTQISNTFTATPVTYANAESYQTSGGAFVTLYRIDFTVNLVLAGGASYQFFLDGPAVAAGGNDFRGVRLHASNAALSGSTQQGANDTFLFLDNSNTALTWNSLTGAGTYCTPTPCPGWNKTSDANVQVFATLPQLSSGGTAVPAMSGFALASLALLIAGAAIMVTRRRRT